MLMKQIRIGLLAPVLVCANLTISAQEAGEQFSIASLNVDGLPQKTLVLELNADGTTIMMVTHDPGIRERIREQASLSLMLNMNDGKLDIEK